jgi:hypothetical protein
MSKGAPRTMRFDDKTEIIINNQNGQNFSEKFENLVFELNGTIDRRKSDLKKLEDTIKKRSDELAKLNNKIKCMENFEFNLNVIKKDLKLLYETTDKIKAMQGL